MDAEIFSSLKKRDHLKFRLVDSLVNFEFYSVLALGFGGGGGTLGTKALGARVLRVARKTTIANMIVQTTTDTIRDVIHVSKSVSDMGKLGAATDRLADSLISPSFVQT